MLDLYKDCYHYANMVVANMIVCKWPSLSGQAVALMEKCLSIVILNPSLYNEQSL